MADIVYVFTNQAMPGLVKIGVTTGDVAGRLTALSTATGVPIAFECHYAAVVEDAVRVEKLLHQLFAEYRINPRREFFRIEPEKVVIALSIGNFREATDGVAEVDPEERQALEEVKARRPRINLSAIDVPPGTKLTFSRDEDVTAVVAVDGRNVDFEGECISPSAAALKALHRMGYTTPAASGPEFWMVDGELLDDRRRRIEGEQFDQPPS